MDIKKAIANAGFVFDEFAKICNKERARNKNCLSTDADIDNKICFDHKQVYLLWDGAFSAARSINPSDEDFSLYSRFIKGAVYCHSRIGCSITHKVHLMWSHVYEQMKIPGGLGESYNTNHRDPRRFRTTRDLYVHANARARASQRRTNPDIMAQRLTVEEGARCDLQNDQALQKVK